MSSRKDDLADRMRATVAGGGAVTRKAGEAQRSDTGIVVGRTLRITVDISAEQHRALRLAALDRGVTGMDVIRAYLDDLVAGGERSREILDAIDGQ